MKTRNGLPLMRDMCELLDKHGVFGWLDNWAKLGKVCYHSNNFMNARADLIVQELNILGFTTEHVRPELGSGITGSIIVNRKRSIRES